MRLLACGAYTHVFKTCVQTFVTTSFEVIVIVSFLCIGDQSSFVRSFVHFVLFVGGCSIMAEEVEDTGKRKIDNDEAWERYVKRFRSNFEAAEQFIADEKLVGNEDQRRGLKKKRVNRMGPPSSAVGAGGTSKTGNTARALLFDPEKRQVLIECIPQKVR